MSGVVSIVTCDGTWLCRDIRSGTVASGATLEDAMAELRRLMSTRQAA